MKKKGVSFEEVYDLFAIRVILDSPPEKEKEECWKEKDKGRREREGKREGKK